VQTAAVTRTTNGSRDTREAILDATDRLLVRAGFRGVTMDDIAAEAGVSRRTIYVYFASKEEVGLSSIDRVVAQTYDRLRAIAAREQQPERALRAVLVERVLFRIDSVREYRRSLDELFEAVRPAYLERRKQQHKLEAKLIAGLLESGRARGTFHFEDTSLTALTLVRATNAFLPHSLSVDELGARSKVARGIQHMADLLLAGLMRPGVHRR
jgi:AcrR family transcriptional regulator